jgi:hypothetical protein
VGFLFGYIIRLFPLGREHMALMNNAILKISSVVVIFFFSWSFIGFCDIAYAIDKSLKEGSAAVAKEGNTGAKQPEEKFQNALDEIGQILKDPATDINTKKNSLKLKMEEVDALDREIRKGFAVAEKKLKDSGLSSEILQRHYNFVKHYDGNLGELDGNLSLIERAKTDSEAQAAIERAKAHLERVKPPKRHRPLDPDKLPHRTAEPVWKEPRTKPEDFIEDIQKPTVANLNKKPILVASAGPLTGLFDSSTDTEHSLLLAFANPPTQTDLSETIEVKFTPAIMAKAEELGHNPVKIYEFVRNNVEYVPTFGSIQGADYCLQTLQCNDMDTASLLIALLRVSGIHARYVYGTIELPVEKAMNWAGGFTDTNAALEFIASGGTPVAGVVEGGRIAKVRMEHMWVEAYMPYGNYRGSMRDDSIKTWIPLDGSYKQYNYQRGMDLYTAMAINGESYIQAYLSNASSPIPAELQSLFPNFVTSPYQYYSKRFFDFLDANFPDAGNEEIIGAETVELSKSIIVKEYPYLLGSLSYQAVSKRGSYDSIPNADRHRLSFSIQDSFEDSTTLFYEATLPELAGKRITLSYPPATSADEAVAAQYGSIFNAPAYLVNVKPVLKINGSEVATGAAVGIGKIQNFAMQFSLPNRSPNIITNVVTAGDYRGIAVQYNKATVNLVGDSMSTLMGNIGSSNLDDLLGQVLYNIGLSYLHHLSFEEELYAKNFQLALMKEPSEAMAIAHAVTKWMWGVPYSVKEGGIGIDVDRHIYVPVSLDGDGQRAKDFMIVSGLGGSAWEHMVLESFFDIPSVSAARLLKMAAQQGMPIYTITNANAAGIIPSLEVGDEVLEDIRNAVNAGKEVVISKGNIRYNDWNGVGYIVLDPVTGAVAYMISGGLAGGGTSTKMPTSVFELASWSKDGSALKTIYTRDAVIKIAMTYLDTPYIWGGANPECGFDCSGFVYYVFTKVYGMEIFGPHRLWTAAAQHDYLEDMNMTHPYNERLPGDILWRGDYGHTGVALNVVSPDERVIHASGHPCADQQDPNGSRPPQNCIVPGTEGKSLICGKFRRVVITGHDIFGTPASNIGRPVP